MSKVRPATLLDVAWVASRMRPEDRLSVPDPWMFVHGVSRVPGRYEALVNARNEPVAVAGLNMLAPKEAFLWLLACEDLHPYALSLRRAAQRWMDELYLKQVKVRTRAPESWGLANNWLDHLGFKLLNSKDGFNLYERS